MGLRCPREPSPRIWTRNADKVRFWTENADMFGADPEQTWGRLSHNTLERTRILAESRKPLTKEICQLTVEDSAANLKQLVSPLRGPAHGLLLAHSLIN
jgi:hypothetical protein